MTETPLRILIVEDIPSDAELAERELLKEGISFTSLMVETKEEFQRALEEFKPHLVISDYALPEFNGMEALKLSLAYDPLLPFILFTGSMNEETAVTCMKAGATDYIIKEHITRLPFAVKEALEQRKALQSRKEADEALRRAEEKYRSIFENAVEGIFQTTLEGRFITVNPALARIHGYDSPEDMLNCVNDIGSQLYVDPERRREYVRLLYEKGIVENFEAEAYRKDGTRIWASINVRAVRDDAGNMRSFEGTLEDITSQKQTEGNLKEALERLRKSIGTIIQVLVQAVEARDPYTAGHQKRTTDLARTIAVAMNLPPEKIEGIRMAGAIHDIGKISVPAEILSKPSRLSDIEMSIVRAHAQYGYQILRDVESPWPLAQIVYQHHERMDGSGYPQVLKGEEILIEARILAVADTVEAMASHRPYRPALGIDAALEEIERNKGVLYDQKAVEACVELFRDKGFRLE